MPLCKIHNVGFYKPEANTVNCMAIDRTRNKLALSRSNGAIEIWNLSHTPFIEKSLPPHLENFSVEALCWTSENLFSVGLHGWLVQYNLFSLNIKNKFALTGGAAACLDSHEKQIAVGTEQGYINIFQLEDTEVEFSKFLDKQEGRIICLKYDKTGEFVVAGSINAIRIWNVKSGHAIHKMGLGRAEAKKDTLVWCLEVMSDFTIFSGDSRGVLTLWDGKLGAHIESYQSHKADITAICLSEKEDAVYAAGVDPLITNYQKVIVGTNVKWVRSIQRKIHDHDVRAMTFHRGRLYSAGVDTYLVCSYHPPKTLVKYAPVLQSPCVQATASKNRRLLLRYSKHIEVWSLSSTGKVPENYRGIINPKEKPKKLLVLQKIGKNCYGKDDAEGITCASISANGQYIFLGTYTGYKLYKFDMVGGKPKLEKVDLDDSNIPCIQACFNDKFYQLIVVLNNGNIIIYELEEEDPFVIQRIQYIEEYLSDTATLLTVSKCGQHLALADSLSNIVLFKRTNDGYSFNLKLPRYEAAPTALAFNPATCHVVVAYADSQIREYNLEERKLTNLSLELDRSSEWKKISHPIRNIAFDSRESSAIFLHDDGHIIVINRSERTPVKHEPKKKKRMENGHCNLEQASKLHLTIKTIPRYKHLIHLVSLAEGEFVAVEINPLSIIEKLPPAFEQKTFGTK